MATSDERRWNRNARHTSATTINSSTSVPLRLETARPMSAERSYVVTISTPSGRLRLRFSSFARTALMVESAFSPWRMTTMPPATSPSPLSSAMPRRISGPSRISATCASMIAWPAEPTPSGTWRKSSTLFR